MLGLFTGAGICFIILIMLRKSLTAWRWLAAGLVMALLFTVYPIVYTFYLSFTNMSGGHLLTKAQAIQFLSQESYRPDDVSWEWTAYQKGRDFLLLLDDQEGHFYTIKPGSLPDSISLPGGSPPREIDGYSMMSPAQTMQNIQVIGDIDFGQYPNIIKVLSLAEVAVLLPVYSYNSADDIFTDNRSGETFRSLQGAYTSDSGRRLNPGYIVNVGWSNYIRFLGNQGYMQPVLRIFIWNIFFALFSVLLSFGIGMMIALLFEDLKYKQVIRTLLIIPYPIPVLVSIMVWRALLNENMGLVTTIISNIFGSSPRFFTDANATRMALIMINVYLSYPYFYILSSGALRSIPGELFEAASIDGASTFTVIRKITMPMIMRILAPLLIASFSFNFNNFTLIWGFNAGLPAMADTAVPMGHTDLLISFIYRLGFSSSNAADYGFSAAITVLLFFVVAILVFFQTMNTRTIKEA